MPGWIRKSSGLITTAKLVCAKNCRYFGFTCVTGGTNKQFTAYNGNAIMDGKEVEYMLCDGNKPTDGHDHGDAVQCTEGLYVVPESGSKVIVWYNDEIDR